MNLQIYREKERERERDRQTDRQTDRQRQTERETERETDRQTERDRQRQRQRDRGRDRQSKIANIYKYMCIYIYIIYVGSKRKMLQKRYLNFYIQKEHKTETKSHPQHHLV